MHTIQYGILHNRKTAGTALKDVIEQQRIRTPKDTIVSFEHAMTFPRFVSEYSRSQAIFFVRDPVSRFVSGFYSRLREGKPRYFYPWSSKEKRAFKRFNHPNQLAEALSSRNPMKRFFATSAMKSIGHIKHTYEGFLGNLDFLKQHADKIAYIGHQPDFSADFSRLRSLLNIDSDLAPPEDNIAAHRNPDHVDKKLSERAISNLQKWYARDYEIYEWCLKKRGEIVDVLSSRLSTF